MKQLKAGSINEYFQSEVHTLDLVHRLEAMCFTFLENVLGLREDQGAHLSVGFERKLHPRQDYFQVVLDRLYGLIKKRLAAERKT